MMLLTKYFGGQNGETIIASKSLDFPEQKSFFGHLKHIELSFYKMWVEISGIPDSVTYDPLNLVRIRFTGILEGIEGAQLNNLSIKSYNNPYLIILDDSAIHDCSDLNLTQFTVRIKVYAQKTVSDTIVNEEFDVLIMLQKAIPVPSYRMELSYPSITYQHQIVNIGEFVVENKCFLRYAMMLDLKIDLRFNRVFNENLALWGDLTEIIESNPYFDVGVGVRCASDQIQSVLEKTIDQQSLLLKSIVAQNEIRIPIYLDMTQLCNPVSDFEEYSFTLSIQNLNNRIIESKAETFTVFRDRQLTQLAVKVNGCELKLGDHLNIGKAKWIQYIPGGKVRFAGTTDLFHVTIGNLAENESENLGAAVYVRNLVVKHQLSNMAELSRNSTLVDAVEVRVQGELEDNMKFVNAPGSNIELVYTLLHSKVLDMDDCVSVSTTIDFDYIEDIEGTGVDSGILMHFVGTIEQIIEKDPGTNWLCIDFGTSATVAAYGDGSNRGSKVLNLDQRSEALLSVFAQKLRGPRFEQGSPFLSSNVLLYNHGVLQTAEYRNAFVRLSPSEPQFYGSSAVLPYVKSLVGYKQLPLSFDFSSLQYKQLNTDKKEINFAEKPLSVDEIFVAVYRSLFLDFIVPEIGTTSEPVNKLILSIPNTYTPRHVDHLRNVIIQNFPQIRKDYIWFVSESDAIASYYLSKWHSLNIDRDEVCKQKILDNIEHILVYDMGAGTLDLTYLSIKKDSDSERTVNIEAKIGLNKAGNYLDYILATALIETHPQFPRILIESSVDANLMRLSGILKHFIKNFVKPLLFTDDLIICDDFNGEQILVGDQNISFSDVEIDLKKLREHHAVQEFINECTGRLLDNFFTIYNKEEGNVPIDTVVLSGRSVQFGDSSRGIEHSLMEAVYRWNNSSSDVYVIRIKGDDLKKIVVNGALSFATTYCGEGSSVKIINKNIYASYGLIYTKPDGRTTYVELLSPTTKPTKEPNLEFNSTNGVFIYQYDTDIYRADGSTRGTKINLSGSPMAYFVQSYSTDPAKDWDEENRELISVMFEFSPRSVVVNPRIDLVQVPVRIVVNEHNEMAFHAGIITNEASAPMVIDIQDNESFRRSMWPYM